MGHMLDVDVSYEGPATSPLGKNARHQDGVVVGQVVRDPRRLTVMAVPPLGTATLYLISDDVATTHVSRVYRLKA